MPSVSKQQFKFLKGVQSGSIKKEGLSPEKAKEMTAGNKGKKAFKKLPFRKLQKHLKAD